MKTLSSDRTFGTPSLVSPFNMCSSRNPRGFSSTIIFLVIGEYCFTFLYFCNCAKSLSADTIIISSYAPNSCVPIQICAIQSSASVPHTFIVRYGKFSVISSNTMLVIRNNSSQSTLDESRVFLRFALYSGNISLRQLPPASDTTTMSPYSLKRCLYIRIEFKIMCRIISSFSPNLCAIILLIAIPL